MNKLDLFNRLPSIYRTSDVDGHLQRFLDVLTKGLDEVEKYIIDFDKMYDIRNMPSEFLDLMAITYDIKLPSTLTDVQRRKFLKTTPYIYKYKGLATSFNYLARNIFGDVVTQVTSEGRNVVVSVEVSGELTEATLKEQQFMLMAEQFRPINSNIVMLYSFTFAEARPKSSIQYQDEMITSLIESYGTDLFVNGLSVLNRQTPNVFNVVASADIGLRMNAFRTYNGTSTVDSIVRPTIEYVGM